ncbi:hypothetical protein CFP65_4833 [Kitasatospora sp. MMS16-BH015]|uniref:hypothetical protein n=1 Tax=Kitasatospora sp. MMS16-BH015 TaxID=2018025 RepID=UPI000CA281E6|nr:hypothetical protein [Kitasatospora sp. MMS16-BH015]AUG79553.1 hypothetical protein CFP65_4833 [Kitasatospora sp. MMS16-BH015]
MPVETIAFALIGLAVGVGALALLPGWYRAPRTLTVATGLVAALLGGLISRYALDGRLPGISLAIALLGAVALVSVLARPDLADRRPRGRHRHA